jgi:acyl-CoA thioesterase FadM
MTRFLRIIISILRALFRANMAPLDESVVHLRVWPHEADWSNVHQAIYPLYMELGRWDVAIRSGLGRWMLTQRCAGILGGQMIRYHRPLKRFQAFELRTRVLGWDEKWFYMEHRLDSHGRTMTVGYVQLMFLNPQGKRIEPATAILACGGDKNSPPLGSMPELLAHFTGASDTAQAQHNSVRKGPAE